MIMMIGYAAFGQTKEKFPLTVGAAKIDITPKNQPTAPATGKYDHERAFVRSIVLDNGTARAALITIEGSLNQVSWAELVKQLTTELKCPAENIVISTTHSHSVGNVGGPPPQPQASTQNNPQGSPQVNISPLVATIMDATRQAKSKLQPARMGFGQGVCYLNVNRDVIDPETRKWTQAANLDGSTDKTVDVLKFQTLSGEPIAVYMS